MCGQKRRREFRHVREARRQVASASRAGPLAAAGFPVAPASEPRQCAISWNLSDHFVCTVTFWRQKEARKRREPSPCLPRRRRRRPSLAPPIRRLLDVLGSSHASILPVFSLLYRGIALSIPKRIFFAPLLQDAPEVEEEAYEAPEAASSSHAPALQVIRATAWIARRTVGPQTMGAEARRRRWASGGGVQGSGLRDGGLLESIPTQTITSLPANAPSSQNSR